MFGFVFGLVIKTLFFDYCIAIILLTPQPSIGWISQIQGI